MQLQTQPTMSGVHDYYAPVQGLSGAALRTGLQELLERTQHGAGYNPARDAMFRSLDRIGGSSAMSDIYTGAQLVGVASRATANAHDVNTEHLWPQSRGATGTARSDLHHMAATAAKVNQYRWHLPFGAVVDAQDGAAPYRIADGAGSVGFDASGRLVFEPRDEVKGRIARSLMYVALRYGADDTLPREYDERDFTDSLPVLLDWSARFAPTESERTHDDQVQAIQGNRNPFIDHPEWAAPVFTGRATTPAPRPRAEQVDDWSSFLRDPAGYSRAHEND